MKKFTIGFIAHDEEVYNKHLGPSIIALDEEYDVIHTTDEKCPATNYNTIIEKSTTPYIILTHQDISFSKDLLKQIEITIDAVGDDFGALGLVGVNGNRDYLWANLDYIHEVQTLDACFIVIRRENALRFDDVIYDDFHLYVENYCAEITHEPYNQQVFTILMGGVGDPEDVNPDGTHMTHHSSTLVKEGVVWGRYYEYLQKFFVKWRNIQVT